MKKNNATNPRPPDPRIKRFRLEKELLIGLKLPNDMHHRVLQYLARRAGLDDNGGMPL